MEENSNDFTFEIYVEKENLNVNESIPNKNKVTANDMNQIRNNLLNGVYTGTYTDEELQQPIPISNDILKDNSGNILNPLIPRYERIVEQNTVNGITYIKYNDGKLIQYGTHTYSVSTDAAYFNIGYRSAEYLFGGEVYPVPFVTLNSLQITDNCRTSNSLIMAVRNNNSKLDKLPKITYVTAGRTTTQIAIDCSFIAIGTWK